MPRQVTISTGARLHFGPLSFRPESGRHFGGIGVMIDQPGFVIHLTQAERDDIVGESLIPRRTWTLLERYRSTVTRDRQPPAVRVNITAEIPEHQGLGSGTQLGLALARGLSWLAGEENVDVQTLALRVGRGARSAVGIYGFEQGGLIVEAGQRCPHDVGALAVRLPLPDDWRVLLITPRTTAGGLSGTVEESVFADLGPMSEVVANRLARIALTEILPAVQTGNFPEFSEAVFEFGRLAGEFFAPVQGGVFGHPQTDQLVNFLQERQVRGVGQTSWGPTVFAFVPNDTAARQLDQELQHSSPVACSVRQATILNRGHMIRGPGGDDSMP